MARTPRPVASVSQLKALTHPLRVRILYTIRAEGSATASIIGQLVDESPASVSYHLRKLADAGFVSETAEPGKDGRERWWQVPEEGFSWSPTDFEDTRDGRATSRAAKQVLVDNQFRRQQEFEHQREGWGGTWTDAAFSTDYVLRLTADELVSMSREVQSVIEKWRDRTESTQPATEERHREHVMVFAHGFPFQP